MLDNNRRDERPAGLETEGVFPLTRAIFRASYAVVPWHSQAISAASPPPPLDSSCAEKRLALRCQPMNHISVAFGCIRKRLELIARTKRS